MFGMKYGYVSKCIIPNEASLMCDYIQNFMKSLMRMFAAEDKGVVFFETVLSLKHQKHTFIECIPLAWEHFDEIPGYFRVREILPRALRLYN